MTDHPHGLDLRIVNGSPTAAELAAVTAVIHGVLDELAENEATRTRATTTAWQRSQRGLRGTIRPGAGAWRGFSA